MFRFIFVSFLIFGVVFYQRVTRLATNERIDHDFETFKSKIEESGFRVEGVAFGQLPTTLNDLREAKGAGWSVAERLIPFLISGGIKEVVTNQEHSNSRLYSVNGVNVLVIHFYYPVFAKAVRMVEDMIKPFVSTSEKICGLVRGSNQALLKCASSATLIKDNMLIVLSNVKESRTVANEGELARREYTPVYGERYKQVLTGLNKLIYLGKRE